MPRAKRVCAKQECPSPATTSYCTEHQREADTKRGTTTQRGYGHQHQQQRRQWQPQVDAGNVTCWRCGNPIKPGQPWDLGHNDDDRTKYMGPEHANQCNRAAAGRRSHAR